MSTTLLHSSVEVTANDLLARNTYRIRLHAPELARATRPGQFLMLCLLKALAEWNEDRSIV